MTDSVLSLGHLVIPLLKGVVYEERRPDLWSALLRQQAAVQEYVAVLNLALVVDEAEGYAYLSQADHEGSPEENTPPNALPKLMSHHSMSYPMSILCVFLRKKVLEQDAQSGEVRTILSREQITNQIQVYLPSSGNEAKDIDKIHSHINKAVEWGLLRKLKNDDQQYEVRRIIKAMIDAQFLSDLDQQLQEYQEHAG